MTTEAQTSAQAALAHFEDGVNKLPEWEKIEVQECIDKLRRMVRQYQSSARLAIVGMSLEIAIREKQ